MFDVRFGPIGQILSFLAGTPVNILWTVNPAYVYPAIIICEVWQWTPFMFLLLLAALSNVDPSQLEAAELDGASYWRVLRQIVLPAIAPVVAIAVLIRGLDLFRVFDIIWALTEGGPGSMTETISLYTYVSGFVQFDTSYTAAVAFLVVAVLTIIVTYALRRTELVR
jgi:multiple sugar transport system permease protein